MKKLLSIAFAFTSAIALAQASVAPKAAELLEKAKATHGGAALESLKTYQETVDLTYYDEKGKPAATLTGTIKTDFSSERVRIEFFQDKKLVLIQQYDPKASSSWTIKTGAIKLPKAEAEPVRAGLYQGITALKYGKNRDAASSDGAGKMLELQGELVSLTTKGVKTSYLIDPNGVVLSERNTSSDQLGSMITTYSDVREVGSIKLPYASKSYVEQAKNALFAESKTTEIKVNPSFTTSDFEMPKK
jgi:hypothetical protein